ncbi:hypothetical protein, partial [Marinobacter salarius]|uniref:hypothetical protein n=1 Tax=Marinobacter salarius TaxID=1420917 RepID=UPI001D12E0A7
NPGLPSRYHSVVRFGLGRCPPGMRPEGFDSLAVIADDRLGIANALFSFSQHQVGYVIDSSNKALAAQLPTFAEVNLCLGSYRNWREVFFGVRSVTRVQIFSE